MRVTGTPGTKPGSSPKTICALSCARIRCGLQRLDLHRTTTRRRSSRTLRRVTVFVAARRHGGCRHRAAEDCSARRRWLTAADVLTACSAAPAPPHCRAAQRVHRGLRSTNRSTTRGTMPAWIQRFPARPSSACRATSASSQRNRGAAMPPPRGFAGKPATTWPAPGARREPEARGQRAHADTRPPRHYRAHHSQRRAISTPTARSGRLLPTLLPHGQ